MRNTGHNTAVLVWISRAAEVHSLKGVTLRLLRLIGTGTSFRLWGRFLASIAAMKEALGCSRSSVEKGLKTLRDARLIAYDGQVPSGKGRQFVKYRLSGTPECPLPEWVVEAREQDRERLSEEAPEWEPKEALTWPVTYGTKTTQVTTTDNRSSDSLFEDIAQEELRSSQYPSAQPMRTGPEAGPQPSGSARREPYLGLPPVPGRRTTRRVARDVARHLLGVAVPRKVGDAGGVREEVSPAVCQPGIDLPVEGKIAVTYSPRTTEGAAMTPFTDPALGALPIDIRLFYLGLRSLADTASMIVSDARYLKAELFRYDDDVTPATIGTWISTLAANGKIHNLDHHLQLSDPVDNPSDGGLFELATIPTAPKPLKQNPQQDFEVFWQTWPKGRRIGKGAARKAFLAAVAKGAPSRRIIEAAQLYANTCQMISKESQFIPHPATWLNQERWEDDQEAAPQVRSRTADTYNTGLELVRMYEEQERLESGRPNLELGWGNE